MSKQLAVATAALAVVAISSTEAQWTATGGLSGTGGGRPNYNAGLSYGGSTGWSAGAGVGGQFGGRPSTITGGVQYTSPSPTGWNMNAGIQRSGHATSGGFTLSKRFEEEEENDEQRIGLPNPFSGSTGPYNPIRQGTLEEEEWEANAGISGNGRGRPSWNVGISHKWDEESNDLQGLKSDLLKAAQVIVKANEMGIFDEDAIAEQSVVKSVHKAVKVTAVVAKSGLLEEIIQDEEQSVKNVLTKVSKFAIAADKAGLLEEEEWEMNAGISGNGGKPTWSVGIGHKWDEEFEEQGLSLKKVKKALNKVGKAAGKIANGVEKAQQIGVLEEEEWEMNANISGNGGKPTWNVGIGHKWDEEQHILPAKPTFLCRRVTRPSPQ